VNTAAAEVVNFFEVGFISFFFLSRRFPQKLSSARKRAEFRGGM
jgi:hypothetical protein